MSNINNTFKINKPRANIPDTLEIESIIVKKTGAQPSFSNKGVLYSDNNILIYKSPTNTVTVVANN